MNKYLGTDLVVVDIPLLYETKNLDSYFSAVIVVYWYVISCYRLYYSRRRNSCQKLYPAQE